MKKIFTLFLLLAVGSVAVNADSSKKKPTEEELKAKHVKEQMEREEKFAKEQKFYQADEYDFSEQEIDPKDLETIEVIEPENDFDITDVYRDDI
jgi:uncharacterized membrane protein